MLDRRVRLAASTVAALAVIALALAGCVPVAEPTPTGTPTVSPTATPTSTETASPSPTAAPGWEFMGLTGSSVSAITIDPNDPAVMFAATRGEGVFRSTDSGHTWEQANEGLENLFANTVVVDPSDSQRVFAGTGESAFKGDTGAGVYLSTDGGDSWVNVYGMHAESIAINPQNPAEVYATGAPPVVSSDDGGEVWTPAFEQGDATANLTITSLAIDPANPQTLLAGGVTEGGTGAILRSTSGGAPWQAVLGPTAGHRYVTGVVFSPESSQTAYASGGEGIWTSSDGGSAWELSTESLGEIAALGVLVNPLDDQIVYAAMAENGVYRTANGGETWHRLTDGLEGERVRSLALRLSPQVLYAGTDNGVWAFVIAGELP